MPRQVVTSLIILMNSILVFACHRPQALVQPTTPVVYKSDAIEQLTLENVYNYPSSIQYTTKGSKNPDEVIAYNSRRRQPSQLFTKRTLRIQKILTDSQGSVPLSSSVHSSYRFKQDLSSKNVRKPNTYLRQLSTSGLGSLLLVIGIGLLILGYRFNSGFVAILGLLTAAVGSALSIIGRFTGR